jgi:hypothetical protein
MRGLRKARDSRRGDGHPGILVFLGVMAVLFLAAAVPATWAVELDEALLRIEINATDGDAGFHGKLDGPPWKTMRIKDPNGNEIFELEADGRLKRQGVTENFFESSEPTCEDQPLRRFLKRFPAGTYKFRGATIEGQPLKGEATLSHTLPAAPDIGAFDGSEIPSGSPVVITWAHGGDLGECHDQDLVDEGIIPDPAGVVEDSWEVTVEPDEDELEALGLPLRVFTVQLPADQLMVTVPAEYLQGYLAAGVRTFKFEVGAKKGENQTFSEGSFTIADP